MVLGHELAGVVEAVGKDVKNFSAEDRVFGSTGFGSGTYAEYICLPDDGMLSTMPEKISFEEAAAIPVGGNTALEILKKANIQSGQKVLVYGASGSVGSFALQVAKNLGAEVTGGCSAANVDMVKSLGADKVIDYTKEDFAAAGKTYDVIIDAVDKISRSKCKDSLDENGFFLSVQSLTREKPENLETLKKFFEEGKLKPFIDRSYPFGQMAEAHRYVEKGHKKGNVVILINPESLKLDR